MEATDEDKSLPRRREQGKQTGGFVQIGVHWKWAGGDLVVTLLSCFMTFSSIIVEHRSEDVVIELKHAKVVQRAMKETLTGKRLQPTCKGWNQS